MVAEALGLTPPEIRFLVNRTLNLLDAALAFILGNAVYLWETCTTC